MDAQIRNILERIVVWHDKAVDEEDDCGYLNGDSKKFSGNGWDDIAAIAADASAALKTAK